MQHRSETIFDAIETVCTGLTTTDTRVERTRVYDIDTDGFPALTINKGDDLVVEGSDSNMSFMDRVLDVEIVVHVKSLTTLDTELSVIESEVILAMMTDRTLGLDFVRNTRYEGANKPEVEALEKGVARQTLNFKVLYRHSLTDPEA